MNKDIHYNHADIIRKWMTAIPSNIAVLKEEQVLCRHVPVGLIFRITPIKSGASSVEFHVGEGDKSFGLYFGHGFCFEEICDTGDFVVNVLEAISQGGFHERVWRVNNKIIRTQGELKLKDGTILSDRGSNSFLSFFMTGTVQDIEYASWF